ncbi:MAG: transporter substrate-binding domain-containing protein [Ruminococcaceae bacterium]|nr:transporter substrate-binding domain-containing protein [Oscillospiraceae bacterium]
MKFKKRIGAALVCAVLTAGLITTAGCTKSETAAPASNGTKKVLRVGMECNYAPYNWTQADNSNGAIAIANSSGEYTNGYDVMMAKKIADAIGYDLQIVKTEWDGLAPSVVSGKLDAVVAGMSITEERKKTVDFTDPYYKATIYALVCSDSEYASAKSVEDLKGASCTSQQNTVWYDMLKQIPGANIQPAMKNVPSLIVALSSGKTDVFVTDKPTAMGAEYANKKLVMLDFSGGNGFKASEADVNLGIAVSKSNPELKAAINKALSGISEADRDKIMQDAIAKQPLAQ